MRRTVIIIIVVIAAAAILGAGIFFRSRQQSGGADSAGTGSLPVVTGGGGFPSSTTSGTPANGEASVSSALTKNSVVDYSVDAQGNVVAIEPDGQVSTSIGGRTAIDASHVGVVYAATFSSDNSKVAVELATGSAAPRWNIFDFQKSSWLPIAISASAVAWSPDNTQLAYAGTGNGAGTISLLDLKSTVPRSKIIVRLSALDMTLQWPSGQNLILAERGAAAAIGSAWSLDVTTGNLLPLFQGYQGVELLAGPTKDLVFQAGASGIHGGTLALMDANGNQAAALNFLTLPSKCAFWAAASSTANSLLCAIPRDSQSLGLEVLPDQYYQRGFFTSDNFYKIDLATGQVATIMNDGAHSFDATELKVFGNSLYFVNRVDQKVYRVAFQNL